MRRGENLLDDWIVWGAEMNSVVGTRRVDLAGRLKGQYEGERRGWDGYEMGSLVRGEGG